MDWEDAIRKLDECYFGTRVPRDENTGGKITKGRDGRERPEVAKPRHDSDGWRHGKSRPFVIGKKTYDMDLDSKVITDITYQRLRTALEAKLTLAMVSGKQLDDAYTADEQITEGVPDGETRFRTVKRSRKADATEALAQMARRGIELPA